MKKFNIAQVEQNIKRYLKKKVSISKSLIIMFCMTGLFSVPGVAATGDTSDAVTYGNNNTNEGLSSIIYGRDNKILKNGADYTYVIRQILLGENIVTKHLQYFVGVGKDITVENSNISNIFGRNISVKNSNNALVLGNQIKLNNGAASTILGFNINKNNETNASGSVLLGKDILVDGKVNGAVLIGTDEGTHYSDNNSRYKPTKGKGNGITAVGSGAQALADKASALGFRATANATDSIAMGVGSKVETNGNQSLAIGFETSVDGKNSVAIGRKAKVTGNAQGAIAIGTDDSGYKGGVGSTYKANEAKGRASVAIGAHSEAKEEASTALGTRTTAVGKESLALGSNAQALKNKSVAIGDRAKADLENSVALGAGSVAEASKGEAYLVTKSNGYKENMVVSVGGRRIQKLEAGSADTDAVNVSQLKAVLAKKITFVPDAKSGNNPSNIAVGLDGTLNIKTDDKWTDNGVTYVGDNLATTVTKDKFLIGLKENPNFKEISLGDTDPITLKNTSGNLDLGDKKITNVKAGTDDNDVVTMKQFKEADPIDVAKWKEKLGVTNLDLSLLGNIGSETKKTTLAKGIHFTSDILGIEAKDNGEVNFKLNDKGKEEVKKLSKEAINIKAKDDKVEVTNDNNGTFTIGVNKDKLTEGLAKADLSNIDTEGKNKIKQLIMIKKGDNIEVTPSEDGDKSVYTIGLDKASKEKLDKVGKGEIKEGDNNTVTGAVVHKGIKDAKEELINKGLVFKGDSDKTITKKLGETLEIKGGKTSDLTENNIGVIEDSGVLKVKLAKTLTGLDEIKFEGTGAPTISKTGINMGNTKVTQVADASDDSDAVNLKQINEMFKKQKEKSIVNITLNSPMTFVAKKKDGTLVKLVKEKDENGGPDKIYVLGDTEKKQIKPGEGDYSEFLISALDIDDNGIAKPMKVTNVKDGEISDNSKDAINGSQLGKLLGIDGKNVKINDKGEPVKADGTTPVYNTINAEPGKTPKNVIEATNAVIDAINKGFKVKADGETTKDKKLGDTVEVIASTEEKEGYSGKNLKTYLTDNGAIALLFNDTPIFKKVIVGDDANGSVTIDNGGITIKGKDNKSGDIKLKDGEISIGDSPVITKESAKKLEFAYKVNDETSGKNTTLEDGLTFKVDEASKDDLTITSEDKGVIKFKINKATEISDANKGKIATVDAVKKYVDDKEKAQNEKDKKINDSIKNLQDGTEGAVIYTDKDGNKLKKVGDKFYKASDVKDDGTVNGGATEVTEKKLKLNSTDPITLDNVKDAVDKVSDLTGSETLPDGNNAVNKNDLQKVAKAGLDITGDNEGGKSHQDLGSTLAINGDKKNIETKVEKGKVTISLKEDLDVKSIKVGDTKVESTNDGVKLSKDGKDAKISGVADGTISSDSTDAINGKQLSEILTNLGVNTNGKLGDTDVNKLKDKDGNDKTPTQPKNITSTINDVIDTVNQGLVITDAKNGKSTQYLGSELKIKGNDDQYSDTDYSTSNIATKVENGIVTIGMKKNAEFESIKLGNTTLSVNNDGDILAGDKKIITEETVKNYSPIEYNGDGVAKLRDKDGNVNNPVKLSNIADPTDPDDAVNKKYVDDNIGKIGNRAEEALNKAGTALGGVANAVAMSNLVQVNSYSDYRHNLSAAYGYFGKSHALAIGFSGVTENRRFVYKLSGAVNTNHDLAFGIGAGIMLGDKSERYNEDENNEIKKLEKLNVKKLHDRIDELEKENKEIKEMLNKLMKKFSK